MSSNQTIIIEEGVKHGIFTETEAELMMINGFDIPLHSRTGWLDRGYTIKDGEKPAIETKLWMKNKKHGDEKGNDDPAFVLVPSKLYTEDQVQKLNP